MANIIVNNTEFRPFSFEEMLRPMAIYGQEFRAQQEALAELSTKASVWDGMANEQSDPYAYKMYKKYADDLESRAGQLLREGLSLDSRGKMLQMRSRYSKEITPIEVAYKRREALAEEQRKAALSNPTIRFQRNAGSMSLDDFIKNPSLDYGKSYSGALLTQQVAQAVAHYAKALTKEGKLEALGLPYQYKSRLGYGASPEEVMAVINEAALKGHEGAINFLRGVRDQVMQSSGIADWADAKTYKELEAFANQGLFSAIGETKLNTYKDDNAINAAQHARQVAAQRAAGAKIGAFKDDLLTGLKSDLQGRYKGYRDKKWITSDGRFTKEFAKQAKFGMRAGDLLRLSKNAKTEAEAVKYARQAYRIIFGNSGADTADARMLRRIVENSDKYIAYTDLRSANVSRASINKGVFSKKEIESANSSIKAHLGTPTVRQLTHTLADSDGKELFNSVSSSLGASPVYGLKINSNGKVVPDKTNPILLKDINKGKKAGEEKVYIKHMSQVPTSPDMSIFTLSDGRKVVLSREQMNQAFGESVTNSLIKAQNTFVHGDTNESALGLANMNELMGTSITQWTAPEATGTGTLDFSWDFE